MHHEVGVAADRAGEVAVLRRRQGVVADVRGAVRRPLQAAQDQQVHRQAKPGAANLVQQGLQIRAVRPARERDSQQPQGLGEPAQGVVVRLGMNPPHERDAVAVQ